MQPQQSVDPNFKADSKLVIARRSLEYRYQDLYVQEIEERIAQREVITDPSPGVKDGLGKIQSEIKRLNRVIETLKDIIKDEEKKESS